MKNLVFIFGLVLSIIACSNGNTTANETVTDSVGVDTVQVDSTMVDTINID